VSLLGFFSFWLLGFSDKTKESRPVLTDRVPCVYTMTNRR